MTGSDPAPEDRAPGTAADGTGWISGQSRRGGRHAFLGGLSVHPRFGSGLGNTRLDHTGPIQAHAFP